MAIRLLLIRPQLAMLGAFWGRLLIQEGKDGEKRTHA